MSCLCRENLLIMSEPLGILLPQMAVSLLQLTSGHSLGSLRVWACCQQGNWNQRDFFICEIHSHRQRLFTYYRLPFTAKNCFYIIYLLYNYLKLYTIISIKYFLFIKQIYLTQSPSSLNQLWLYIICIPF